MAWPDILTFTFIASLLVMSPGPNGLLIAKTVPASGRAAGFANIFGFVCAFYLHGALSILGISIILVNSSTAFAFVKYLGAAYLCWIGLKALRDSVRITSAAPSAASTRRKRRLTTAFMEGLLTNALNPKVSMFYLAAFPQFISAADSAVTSSFLLVFVHSMINAIWFGMMVILFSRLSTMARHPSFQRWLKGVTGVVFVAFGVRLATFKANL